MSTFPRAAFAKPTVTVPILVVKPRFTAFSHVILNQTTKHKLYFG